MQILRLGRFILPAVAAVLVLWVLLEQVEVSGRYELSFPERHRAVELTDMTPAPSRGTAVAVARSVSPAAGHPPAGTEGTQDDAGENAIEGVEAPAPGLGLTSVAQLDARYYVLASNRGLMLLDRDNAVACRIHVAYPFDGYRTNHGPLDGPPAPGDPSPTGVFIDSAGDLYVADGGADRVLRGSVDPERCRVRIETAYSSSFALGPRNLFADRGRDLLVSANHDSGTVSAFRLSNRELLWTAEVPGAHGVAIQGDKVYATSLITRMVYALDLRDGKQLRARGYPGWDPMRAGYLKPTSIHPFGDRELILTDAHSGFVSFLRARKLKVSRYTGGNGPSSRWLNHPYAAVPIGGGIVVVSSLRDQILFLDPDGRRILESFSFGREHWRDESPRGRPMGEGWGAYHSVEGPGLSIRGRSYELGFGRVNPPDNGSGSAPILTIRGFDDFLQGGRGPQEVQLLFTSQSGVLLGLVSRDGQPQLVLRRPIPPDTWLHDSELLVPSGQDLPVADIEKELSSRADSIYRELEETGWISPRRYYRLGRAAGTTPGASFADFRTRLAGRFTSVPGRKFKRIYDRCDDRSCNLAMLKRAARLYYRESDRYLQTDLEEYLLVGTLTGVRADHERTPEQDLVFDNCGSADYFEGHGLRALTTKSPEDYLSAYDSASTEVCFTLNPDKVRSLRRLMLVWHSKERVPKGLSLTGFEDPNGVWSKGYHSELRDPPGFATGQLFSSYIDITQETRFGRYRLAVTEEDDSGGLLVLRAIVPIFGKSDGARRDPLFSLVQEVNASMPYGEGVGRLPPEVPVSVESAVRYLLSAESAHCGNYSFVFASRLQPNTSWTIFGLQSFDGRAHHAVVEVQDGQSLRTFDPTLGVVYNCGIEPLIDGSCDYDDYLSGNLHPAFNRYFGVRLLYGARILSVYESLADFL